MLFFLSKSRRKSPEMTLPGVVIGISLLEMCEYKKYIESLPKVSSEILKQYFQLKGERQ